MSPLASCNLSRIRSNIAAPWPIWKTSHLRACVSVLPASVCSTNFEIDVGLELELVSRDVTTSCRLQSADAAWQVPLRKAEVTTVGSPPVFIYVAPLSAYGTAPTNAAFLKFILPQSTPESINILMAGMPKASVHQQPLFPPTFPVYDTVYRYWCFPQHYR